MSAFRIILIALLFMAMQVACDSTKSAYVSKPVRSAANADEDLLQTELAALHLNDSITNLYIQVENEKLLYRRNDTGLSFQARLNIRVLVFAEGNDKRIIDSAFKEIRDISISEKIAAKKIQVNLPIKTPKAVYKAVVEFYDLNRHVKYFENFRIDHRNSTGPQNFLAVENDTVAFKTNFLPNENLRILAPNVVGKQVYVDVYRQEFGAALPPFSAKDQYEDATRIDSTYALPVNNAIAVLSMPSSGAVLLRGSKESKEGMCLFVAEDAFPGISNNTEMIQCTRYIMSKEEFDACLTADDQKLAIDNFWLGIGGSKERSRELVRRYYGRVKDANKLYSSFVPGWKTDRGMIYIVLGAPFSKYSDKSGEVWVYGNDANPNSLRFVFKLRKNALTENDMVLERSIFYREPFHNAVEYWRQGIVFNDYRR